MPPVLNIIALATFAASLSARALDPVLPHVASDFNVSIAAAAGFASVFAFTFAIHPAGAGRRGGFVRQGAPRDPVPGAARPRQPATRPILVVFPLVPGPHTH